MTDEIMNYYTTYCIDCRVQCPSENLTLDLKDNYKLPPGYNKFYDFFRSKCGEWGKLNIDNKETYFRFRINSYNVFTFLRHDTITSICKNDLWFLYMKKSNHSAWYGYDRFRCNEWISIASKYLGDNESMRSHIYINCNPENELHGKLLFHTFTGAPDRLHKGGYSGITSSQTLGIYLSSFHFEDFLRILIDEQESIQSCDNLDSVIEYFSFNHFDEDKYIKRRKKQIEKYLIDSFPKDLYNIVFSYLDK